MSNPHAFQFTPYGIRPLDQATPAPGDMVPGGAALAATRAIEISPPHDAAQPALAQCLVPIAPATAFTPKDVIRLAKARRKELTSEIKRLKSLQKELAEIERLLVAAKAKPKPVVRVLPNRSA